jgi:tRNA threonylcarbamoyladenosine modification (KEOPS) complex  Pcc1 subunit
MVHVTCLWEVKDSGGSRSSMQVKQGKLRLESTAADSNEMKTRNV